MIFAHIPIARWSKGPLPSCFQRRPAGDRDGAVLQDPGDPGPGAAPVRGHLGERAPGLLPALLRLPLPGQPPLPHRDPNRYLPHKVCTIFASLKT